MSLLSLKWYVWLSSSGNNCHAVHRPLSSGESVWLYRGILPCPIMSARPAYANGICNFRVFGMACLPGSKVNIQQTRTSRKWMLFPNSRVKVDTRCSWLTTRKTIRFLIEKRKAGKCHQHTVYKNWLVGFLWHINFCRLFNTKSIFMNIVPFQAIQFSISTDFVYTQLNFKTVLY